MLSLGLNSVYEMQSMAESKSGNTESTRPATSAAASHIDFMQKERGVRTHPFKTFYTSGERVEQYDEEAKKQFFQFTAEKQEVVYDRQNKFHGKSSYLSYVPAKDHIDERKLEAVWWQHQNRKLQEKRRDEETKMILNQWSEARGRMESEIQRRKE